MSAARLTAAREELRAIAAEARDEATRLREAQAAQHATVAEAVHMHRVAAIELTRAMRARHRTTADRGERPVHLVEYVEPPPPRGLLPREPPRPVRWPRARRVLATIVRALFVLTILATPASAAPRCRTPISEAGLIAALRAGHVRVFGLAPGHERLLVARAQVSLEVGRGRKMRGNNPGNIGARRRDPHCMAGAFRVRRYATPAAGAAAYWGLRAVRRALPWFDAGDPRGAALALGRAGYYEADPEIYAAGMAALYAEFARSSRR